MTMNAVKKFTGTRRRVLGGVGASALVASAGIFGKGEAAQAARPPAPYCCNLAHPTGANHISYSSCVARAAYIWYCDTGTGQIRCNCCETAGNAQSAESCHY
jgi:hypothetical protein